MIKPGGTRIATSAARDRVQAQHKAAGLARDALYLLRADTQVALADPTAAPNAVYRYCAAFGSRPNALLSRARSAATHNGLETSARGHLSGGTSNLRFGSNPAGLFPTRRMTAVNAKASFDRQQRRVGSLTSYPLTAGRDTCCIE